MAAQKPLVYSGGVRQELPSGDWVRGGLTGLQPETGLLLDAMTVQPYTGRVALIDWTILQFKKTGLWVKLDGIWFFAAHDAQAARLNWITPSSGAFTEVNSIPFTEDSGYTGDGVSMALSSTHIPGTSGNQYTQNSAHLGIFVLTATAVTGIDAGAGISPTNLRIRARTGSDTFFINDITGLTHNGADESPSHSVISRRDSSGGVYFVNGALKATFTVPSTGMPNSGLLVGRAGGSGYSDRRWSCVHVGASLTDADNVAIARIVGEYLSEVGAL